VLTISYRRGDLKGSVKGWVFLFLITSMALSFYIWLKVFYKISLIGKDDIGDYIYVFLPQQKIFILPAVLMGYLTVFIAVDFLSRVFLKRYYFEICDFLKIYGGFSSYRSRFLLDMFFGLFSFATIIYLVFFSNWYVIFRNDVIVSNSLGGFGERTYNYSQIEKIYVSTHSKLSNAVYKNFAVRIVFNDEKKITTSDFGYRFAQQEIQSFIDFVSEKTKKEPVVKKFMEDFK